MHMTSQEQGGFVCWCPAFYTVEIKPCGSHVWETKSYVTDTPCTHGSWIYDRAAAAEQGGWSPFNEHLPTWKTVNALPTSHCTQKPVPGRLTKIGKAP